MGIYIKGLKMPENCYDCPCYQDAYDFYPYCMAIKGQEKVDGGHLEKNGEGRHKDCPLIAVPEPHGRLIDEENIGKWSILSDGLYEYVQCNQCKHIQKNISNFCPHCGCQMEKGKII